MSYTEDSVGLPPLSYVDISFAIPLKYRGKIQQTSRRFPDFPPSGSAADASLSLRLRFKVCRQSVYSGTRRKLKINKTYSYPGNRRRYELAQNGVFVSCLMMPSCYLVSLSRLSRGRVSEQRCCYRGEEVWYVQGLFWQTGCSTHRAGEQSASRHAITTLIH